MTPVGNQAEAWRRGRPVVTTREHGADAIGAEVEDKCPRGREGVWGRDAHHDVAVRDRGVRGSPTIIGPSNARPHTSSEERPLTYRFSRRA
jgi:hypothetical protein